MYLARAIVVNNRLKYLRLLHQVFYIPHTVCSGLSTNYGFARHIISVTDARMVVVVSAAMNLDRV